MKVKIFFTRFNSGEETVILNQWLSFLPIALQNINHQFINKEDKVRNLLGKLLLIEALKKSNHQSISLENIKFNNYLKPYLCNNLDFSISHSENYVFCAFGENLKLGIDIEKIQPINFDDFENIMNENEWFEIKTTSDSVLKFFDLWTLKEALIKAEGKGFFADLNKIIITRTNIEFENNTWFYQKLDFDENYSGHIVINHFHTEIEMIFTRFI